MCECVGFYYNDAINDEAAPFIREVVVAKYDGTYNVRWDVVRVRRYRRQIDLGLIDEATCPLPHAPR